MPRADYVPYTTVKPEGPRQVTERVDIRFPEVAFHNSVGQALAQVGEQGFGTLSRATKEVANGFDNLGANFAHTGTELWNRAIGLQDVQNQTTQAKAEIEFDKYVGEKQIAFKQLEGDAANETTFKAHLKDIEDKRTEMLGKLPNQAVQHGFDQSTGRSVARAGMAAAEHAATETRKSFIMSSEARVDQYKDQLSRSTDIKETKEIADKIHDEVFGKQAPARGWSLDVATNNLKKLLTDAYASQAATMSRTDPIGARKLLEANKDFIGQAKYDSTMEHILDNERNIVSNNVGNDVQGANPDGTIEEKKEAAKKRLTEVKPEYDPKLLEATLHATERKHEDHRREVRQQEERDKETIENELYGFGNPQGTVPTSRYDLFKNEEARKAFERSTPAHKNRVDQILAKHAKGDYPDTPTARMRQWDLWGMAINEPGRFRDLDLMQEEIPWAMRSELRREQLKIVKEGIKLEADPQTSHAISVMRSNGVLPKDLTPLHAQKWNLFTGLVREGVIAEGKKKGFDKPLTQEEIINLGKTLLDKMPGTGYWPNQLDWGQQQLYQTLDKIPPEHIDALRSRFPGKTDDELTRLYRQKTIQIEYDKRYGKAGTKLPEQAPAVTVKTPPEKPPEPPPEQQQGPPKPAEKRSEMLTRKAAEFRGKLMTEGARKREEEAKAKR